MTRSRKDLFSVKDEIAVHSELPHERVSAETLPEPKRETADYYNSVAFEPGRQGSEQKFQELIRAENAKYSPASIAAVTILSGIAGGVFAVPAVFLRGQVSWIQIFMLVVFGPFAEETLKQSGMIFLLEKRPGAVRYDWQFFLAGSLGALVFASLENLIYQWVYLAHLPPEKLVMTMSFRWVICTAMHLACTQISALGLRRVWRNGRTKNMPTQISEAFSWFAAAMAVHGGYNLAAILWFERFFT